MSGPIRYPVTIICEGCQVPFVTENHGRATAKYCTRSCAAQNAHPRQMVSKICVQCLHPFSFRSSGEKNNAKRRFCSNPCAGAWRMAQPGRTEHFNEKIADARAEATRKRKGQKVPACSARMKANNPMSNPAAVEKMRKSKQGQTFLSRGGNSTITEPQRILSEALGLPIEHPIVTAPVKGQFPSLPNCYKVDIADLDRKLAIEVDGKTHRLKRWKFLDARKTSVLNALGWSVLRFSNERVMQDLEAVIAEISAFTALKSPSTITSLPMAS